MTCTNGWCTSDEKWIKTIIKTPIRFNSKGNEIIGHYSLNVWSCFLLNSHHHCMCYCCQCLLHHIYMSRINNNNVHQGREVVFGDKDIHLSLGVVREKVKTSLWTCAQFSKTIIMIVSKNISWVVVLSLPQRDRTNGYLDHH